MTKHKHIWIWIALGLAILWIWGQSLLPESASAEESGWVMTHLVNPVAEFLFGSKLSHNTVRKLAHVAEFTALGLLLYPVARLIKPKFSLLIALGAGFLTAFLDETLQIVSSRGPMIADVWIDLIGVALGTGLCFLGYLISDRRKKQSDRGRKHA